MGAVEEAGKTASGFMEAMKSQPLSLALVIMNIVLLVVLYQVFTKADESRQAQMELIFGAQREMQVLLSKCVVPDSK